MKWDFFYDEGSGRPYESLGDWYRDIGHLVYPLIVMIGIGIVVFLYIVFFAS